MAVAQGFYGILLLRMPGKTLFLFGIIGTLSLLGLYVITRTLGIPFFGPHAGQVEDIGALDLASKTVEAALIVVLFGLARASPRVGGGQERSYT